VEAELIVNNIPQWRLVYIEDLTNGSIGWDNQRADLITDCPNGVRMLGGPDGHFSAGEIVKEFSALPSHERLKIKAIYHFIDDWSGEMGFVRANLGSDGEMVHIWSHAHTENSAGGVSICGGLTPDSAFAVPVQISFPHIDSSIRIGIGSTIEDDLPELQSWGMSGFELYVQ